MLNEINMSIRNKELKNVYELVISETLCGYQLKHVASGTLNELVFNGTDEAIKAATNEGWEIKNIEDIK